MLVEPGHHQQRSDGGGRLDQYVRPAVNEENAAGGRVVTAPTNGACGIVPAVLAYYDKLPTAGEQQLPARYMLVASAIGSLYKMNASISGAEVGCRRSGVACSMAAAVWPGTAGGSPSQVCIAADRYGAPTSA